MGVSHGPPTASTTSALIQITLAFPVPVKYSNVLIKVLFSKKSRSLIVFTEVQSFLAIEPPAVAVGQRPQKPKKAIR